MKARKYCEFGKAILVKLAELDMTPKELSEKMHCERCQIYSYISGRHQPTMVTLMKLCTALNKVKAENNSVFFWKAYHQTHSADMPINAVKQLQEKSRICFFQECHQTSVTSWKKSF